MTRDRGFASGARAAADVAASYDASSTLPHRPGDCILGELNLRAAPPRRNPDVAWKRGFATGVVEMYSSLLDGADAPGVRRACAAAGLCLDDFREASVARIELRALRRAGVPVRAASVHDRPDPRRSGREANGRTRAKTAQR